MPIKKKNPVKTGVPGIWQDGPNRFLVRVGWTDKKTGKQKKREEVARTFEEAVTIKHTLKGTERKSEPTKQRLSDFVEQWLEDHVSRLGGSTVVRYVHSMARVCETLGDHYVDSLEPADIRRWRDRQRVAPATVNGWLRVLRTVLDDAVVDGILTMNPARAVKGLREGRAGGSRGRSLSIEQFRRFIGTVRQLMAEGEISEDIGRHLLVYAWTGCRRGEGIGLKWIDLSGDELFIRRSVWRRTEKGTKTDDPRRLAVVDELGEVFAAQRRWLIETQHPGLESGLMFPASPRHALGALKRCGTDEMAWYRSESTFAKPLSKVVAAADLPKISLHSLRRTYENLLRKAKVDKVVRQSLAGWRTDEAQEIYAGVDAEERRKAGQAMVNLVRGNGEDSKNDTRLRHPAR